jgi:hypothetical protein
LWINEFTDYDYIGAPWWYDSNNVGNGGFSLRSMKLLQALQDCRLTDLHPEDDRICRKYRELLEISYNIKFAPETVAKVFSFEPNQKTTHIKTNCFGFHGISNLILR